MTKRNTLNRRALLRGAMGAAVALPLLDVMEPRRARAQSETLRYVVMFAGQELKGNVTIPRTTGAGYAMPEGFSSLERVRDHVSLVSNLAFPTSNTPTAPPGGQSGGGFHNKSLGPVLAGVRGEEGKPIFAYGETSDVIVGRALGAGARFESLQLRVQAEAYTGGYGRMSARREGSRMREIDPISSPRLAYDAIFGGFAPPTGGGTSPAPTSTATIDRDRSVLDLVRERASRLLGRVSRADRVRLEQHFEEIRALERRLASITSPGGGGGGGTGSPSACGLPTMPGADPPAVITPTPLRSNMGWSDETRRGAVMVDLVHMALACDLTRSVALQISYAQSMLSAKEIAGVDWDFHQLTHSQAADALGGPGVQRAWAAVTSWHAEHMALLVEKLRDTPEGSATLLDRTVVALQFSGGLAGHGARDLVTPIAGRGSVLRLGEHVRPTIGHPAQALATAMHAVGVSQDLGETTGRIDALLR